MRVQTTVNIGWPESADDVLSEGCDMEIVADLIDAPSVYDEQGWDIDNIELIVNGQNLGDLHPVIAETVCNKWDDQIREAIQEHLNHQTI